MYLEDLLSTSDAVTQELASTFNVQAYLTGLGLSLYLRNLTGQSGTRLVDLTLEADLLDDEIQPMARPGQAASVLQASEIARGVLDNLVEASIFPEPSSTGPLQVLAEVSTTAVFSAAAAQGIPLVTIAPNQEGVLSTLAIDASALARIDHAIQAGMVVLFPPVM